MAFTAAGEIKEFLENNQGAKTTFTKYIGEHYVSIETREGSLFEGVSESLMGAFRVARGQFEAFAGSRPRSAHRYG